MYLPLGHLQIETNQLHAESDYDQRLYGQDINGAGLKDRHVVDVGFDQQDRRADENENVIEPVGPELSESMGCGAKRSRRLNTNRQITEN